MPAEAAEPTRAAPTIAELRPGQRFRGDYACVRKDRLTARNGSPYLSLELRDRSGSISARAFREVDRMAARFERGDAVRVAGKVERFRGELVAELDEVRRLEGTELDPADLLPKAYRDGDELSGFLEHLIREVHDPALRELTERVLLSEPTASEFRRAPCTRGGHHAYLGGLIEHTVAVGTLVGEVCQLHPRLDSDLLMAAALLHDVGKVREFSYGAEFELTEEGRLLGHLALGAEIVGGAAGGLDPGRRAALLHCLLTHHGPEGARTAGGGGHSRGYGGGFGSPEALALHRLNALDASVKGVLEQGLARAA
ncbi:MAG: HD domain-containing protein [Actinobacteria bacterium]|nr:HD domain-containing protein [Actinomycetota bacterium]